MAEKTHQDGYQLGRKNEVRRGRSRASLWLDKGLIDIPGTTLSSRGGEKEKKPSDS